MKFGQCCVFVAGEKPHKCKLCEKCYTQKSGLDVHMYSHTGHKPFECHLCQKQFVARTLWTKHLRSVHNQSEPPFRNMFGRGGYGGVNLLSPVSTSGFDGHPQNQNTTTSSAAAAVEKTSLPPISLPNLCSNIFKSPPPVSVGGSQLPPSAADCLKILQESYFMNRQAQPMTSPHANVKSSATDTMTSSPQQTGSPVTGIRADDSDVTSTNIVASQRPKPDDVTNGNDAKADDSRYVSSASSAMMAANNFDQYFAGYRPKTTYVPGYQVRHPSDAGPMTSRAIDFRQADVSIADAQRHFESTTYANSRPDMNATTQSPYYG